MSLENPNIFDHFKGLATIWKTVAVAVGGLVLLGAVLALFAWQDSCSFRSDIEKKRANVNTAIEQIKNINANIAEKKKEEADALANVKVAAKDYLDAINATDATREEVNHSIDRMKMAANSNRQVNARDVEEAMRGL